MLRVDYSSALIKLVAIRRNSTDLQFGQRRQRLSRLLGTEAMLALDLVDSDPEHDLEELDNVDHRPDLDENLNQKSGTTLMSRVQDYSTTSLEFSDMESLASDSLGRPSEEEGNWNHAKHHSVEDLQLGREPLDFVEFTPADDDADHHPRHTRLLTRLNTSLISLPFNIFVLLLEHRHKTPLI